MAKQIQLFETKKYKNNKNSIYYSFPKLMEEWNYDKNNKLGANPKTIYKTSHEKVWWKCKKCGYEWQTLVLSRTTTNNNCPVCAGVKVMTGYNYLATTNPELLKEWDYSENNKLGLDPTKIKTGSSKRAWWICSNGHKYYSVINNRKKGVGCAICRNKKVLAGYNDLATTNPELLSKWNYEKNDKLGLFPTDFTKVSGKKVWWKCDKGHAWEATIAHIAYGRGCPFCNTGKQTSFPEQTIYYYLKKVDKNCLNRYKVRGKNELDIFLPDLKTGIEYDGYRWHSSEKKMISDFEKDEYWNSIGIRIIRIKEQNKRNSQLIDGDWLELNKDEYYLNDEDYNALADLIKEIVSKLYNKKIEVDIEKDRNKIYNNYLFKEIDNSLSKNKKAMKYYDYEKNLNVKPEYITRSSGKTLWWKCKKGHSFQATVHSVDQGIYCPTCREKMARKGGLIALDENYIKTLKFSEKIKSLLMDAPEIAAEWNYEKNYPVCPENIVSHSNKKYWWKCKKCGYEWQTTPLVRMKGSGCRECGYKSIAKKLSKKVAQYTTNGEFIKEYESVEAAKKKTGIQHISCVCRGDRKKAGGFVWKYVEEQK